MVQVSQSKAKGCEMPDIMLRLGRDVLVAEGAMGTMLQRAGMPAGASCDQLNELDQEMVSDVHRLYHLAGANCAITNTFCGTRSKLAEHDLEDRAEIFNREGVRIARSVHPEHILADIGPCGLLMPPYGQATYEEVFKQYAAQAAMLAAEGPDAIIIETMIDIADACCAVRAARSVCDLPVFATCTFNDQGLMPLSGTSPAAAALALRAAGAAAVGLNCGLGPEQAYPLFKEMAAAVDLPLIVQPNAGLPQVARNGETVYPGTPDEFAVWATRFVAAGASIVGSCCGSTPAFTGAIAAIVGGKDVQPRKLAPGVAVSGPRGLVRIGAGNPVALIGQNIAPSGHPVLRSELLLGEYTEVVELAEDQEDAGAHLLNVSVRTEGVDEAEALAAAVDELAGMTRLPLSFDCIDPAALDAALSRYPGRALINSVSADPASYQAILPIAAEHGAAVVVLASRGWEVPVSAQDRFEAVKEVREAAHAAGLTDADLIVDVVALPVRRDPAAVEVALETIGLVRELGLATMVGVANVSHGMEDRSPTDADFAARAVEAGVDALIVNPRDDLVMDAVERACAHVGETGAPIGE